LTEKQKDRSRNLQLREILRPTTTPEGKGEEIKLMFNPWRGEIEKRGERRVTPQKCREKPEITTPSSTGSDPRTVLSR